MYRYPSFIVEQARELRKNRLSYGEISKLLKVPKNTLQGWCYGYAMINNHNSLVINNEYRRKEIKNQDLFIIPIPGNISVEQARFYAGLLYGCEGCKYPASKHVAFVNSDHTLIKTFLSLFRRGFTLDEEKFRVHLQIHTNHNWQEVKEFWSQLLNIPESKFIKPTITTPRGKMRRQNYFGTCSIRYYDYKLQLRLMGIFENFCKQY